MAPRPTEITLVAKMMDPDMSDDAKELARNIIDALDAMRADREWWLVSARTLRNGPTLTVGPYSTKNQALKAVAGLRGWQHGMETAIYKHAAVAAIDALNGENS